MKKVILFFISILIISGVYADSANALTSDEPCSDVEVIFARGSGSALGGREQDKFLKQISERLGSKVSVHPYELGKETYNNAKYPAVDVGVFNGNAIGALVSGGKANDYGKSVSMGRTELEGYLAKRSQKCPNERIILGGYSQGAQVIGDVHTRLSAYAGRIDFIAFFGDPKLYLPEGEGIYPDACRGKNFSSYRRDIGDCHADNGSLGARKPYLTSKFSNKAGLWCKAVDFICGTSKLAYDLAGHEKYAEEGGPIDKAAKEIAERLKKTLPKEKTTEIKTGHTKVGTGTTGLDVVFVIDTTGSMGGRIEQAKAFARAQAEKIKELRGRVALVAYKDAGDSYTARIISGLSEDQANFQTGLNSIYASGGGDTPEAALHALKTAFNGLDWKNGATKAAVLLTDAGFHNPDLVDGSTIESIAKRSLEIDPVNVYPVVPDYIKGEYSSLAEKTSGQVIVDSGDTNDALTRALTQIADRPTALLKLTEYSAKVREEITFDASDSYVIDGAITKYEWDFNGDGVFEKTTTTPTANYKYAQTFDGTMQVRLTASNGTIASASAVVKIGTYVEPVRPAAPKNLAVKVLETTNNVSRVKLSWKSSDGLATKWAISINGVVLGTVASGQTSIDVTDVLRDKDVVFSVVGVLDDQTLGKTTSKTLGKKTSGGIIIGGGGTRN